MSTPNDRRYTDSHEWHQPVGDTLTLGVTQFAVDQLTDVTYAQLKPVGTRVRAGESVGEVESVKATSDIYSGVDGEIIEINGALGEDPSLINTDPYGAGWLVKLRVKDPGAVERLMDAGAYDAKYAH